MTLNSIDANTLRLYHTATRFLAAVSLAFTLATHWSQPAQAQVVVDALDRPTVRISTAEVSPTNTFPIPVAIVFSEPVSGFDVADIAVNEGTVTRLATNDRLIYLARIAPASDGEMSVQIPAGVAANGSGKVNVASNVFAIVSDTTRPVVDAIVIDQKAGVGAPTYPFVVSFSESVEGVDATDFEVIGGGGVSGQVVAVNGSGSSYTIEVASAGDQGTLALAVRDDDTISDVATNRLGGDGIGNGDYVGPHYEIGGSPPSPLLIVIDGLDPGSGELDGNIGPGTNVGRQLTLDCDLDDDGIADRAILLQDVVEVHDGGVLRIEPGCFVYADTATDPALLLVRRGGRIEAVGTPEAPVVFTSANDTRHFDVGSAFQTRPGDPQAGDWGGLLIVGEGTCNGYNDTTPAGSQGDGIAGDCEIVGLDNTMPGVELVDAIDAGGLGRLLIGSPTPDDASDSGTLQFVRVEHAGRGGLPLLGLFGVGFQTSVRNMHIRSGSSSGLEIRGGSVSISNIMISDVPRHAMAFSQGWNGDAQFLVMRFKSSVGTNDVIGVEGGNNKSEPNDLPGVDHDILRRTAPRLYNVTMLGPGSGTALRLRDGVAGHYRGGLAAGWHVGIDIDGSAAYAGCDGTSAASLFVDDFTFSDGTVVPRTGELTAIDADNESTCTGGGVSVGLTLLSATANEQSAFNPQPIEAVPAVAPPDGSIFDSDATYRGAVSPIGTPFYLRGRWAGLREE